MPRAVALAHDAPGIAQALGLTPSSVSRNFPVCPRTDPEVIAETPVIEIVCATPAVARISRNFILRVTGLRELCLTRFLHRPRGLVVGQGRWIGGECRVWFQRQLIM